MVEDYESKIESRVAEEALKQFGVFSIKIKAAQERGYPDRLFLIPGGTPLFIEFKRKEEKLDRYQHLIHDRLLYAGYSVQVHTRYERALAAIADAVKKANVGGSWNQLLKRPG
jgi:hypothetical protein